jgi:hypothetical protein
MHWGIAIDPDAFPDAEDLVDALRSEAQSLVKLAAESASVGTSRRRG